MGLPSGPGLGFMNSVFQIFMSTKEMKNLLIMLDNNRSDKFIYCLARLNNLLSKQARIEVVDVKDLVELYLNKYNYFQVGMSYSVILFLFSF
jgi:hypothetical protein